MLCPLRSGPAPSPGGNGCRCAHSLSSSVTPRCQHLPTTRHPQAPHATCIGVFNVTCDTKFHPLAQATPGLHDLPSASARRPPCPSPYGPRTWAPFTPRLPPVGAHPYFSTVAPLQEDRLLHPDLLFLKVQLQLHSWEGLIAGLLSARAVATLRCWSRRFFGPDCTVAGCDCSLSVSVLTDPQENQQPRSPAPSWGRLQALSTGLLTDGVPGPLPVL